jgi:hypothetical protein
MANKPAANAPAAAEPKITRAREISASCQLKNEIDTGVEFWIANIATITANANPTTAMASNEIIS